MSLKNIKKMQSERGFTIVELLIVIVVIGILAAIVIVAYNGVTQRANSTSAQAAAETVIKKMEAYNADSSTGGYPAYPSLLTSAASGTTYLLTGVTITDGASGAPTTVPATNNSINFYSCTTGAAVTYWKYDGATPAWTAMYTGGATSLTGCTYKKLSATS